METYLLDIEYAIREGMVSAIIERDYLRIEGKDRHAVVMRRTHTLGISHSCELSVQTSLGAVPILTTPKERAQIYRFMERLYAERVEGDRRSIGEFVQKMAVVVKDAQK